MLNISSSKLDVFLVVTIGLLLVAILYNHRRSSLKTKNERPTLGVGDLIGKVKSELVKAEADRIQSGQPALFELKNFDLEINYIVKESNQGSGSFQLNVITVGVDSNVSIEETQKVTLRLVVAKPHSSESKASQVFPEVDESIVISEPTPSPKKGT